MQPLYHPVHLGSLYLEGNLFLAPIAGYSDAIFRSICCECGASFCTTEMVSSEALTRGSGKTEQLMRRGTSEKAYAVQLFGGNPAVMAAAARIVLAKTDCDCIDINAGCPVPKVVKTGAGSALISDPQKLYSVVKAVVDAAGQYCAGPPERKSVPVTVKIRIGQDAAHLTWRECTAAAVEAGVSALTVHARTRAQGYSGVADWGVQRQLVEAVARRIPVFGSGDAHTPEAAKRMIEETGVDAVMFARGALSDPFLFTRARQYLIEGRCETTPLCDRLSLGLRELEQNVELLGERSACALMRKKFAALTAGVKGAARLREKIVHANTTADYRAIFDQIQH